MRIKVSTSTLNYRYHKHKNFHYKQVCRFASLCLNINENDYSCTSTIAYIDYCACEYTYMHSEY